MPRKTPDGLGTIYQRKDGYWVAALSLGGKRIVRYAPKQEGRPGKAPRAGRREPGGPASPHHQADPGEFPGPVARGCGARPEAQDPGGLSPGLRQPYRPAPGAYSDPILNCSSPRCLGSSPSKQSEWPMPSWKSCALPLTQ